MALEQPGNAARLGIRFGVEARASQTEDGFGTQGIAVFEDMEFRGDEAYISANYSVTRFPEGTWSFCNIQIIRPERGAISAMVDIADARYGELVPGARRFGGEITFEDEAGYWITWAGAGVPHDAVSLRTMDRLTVLVLTRFTSEGSE